MTDLDAHFENLSPLLDDIVARIGALKLCPFKTAWLSAQAMTRIAIGTRLVMADQHLGDGEMTPEERSDLMDKLADSLRKSDAALMAMMERSDREIECGRGHSICVLLTAEAKKSAERRPGQRH